MSESWYRNGLRFSCQRCGTCCYDEGEYTEVYVTRDDIAEMADYLGVTTSTFTRRYVKKPDGFQVLRSRRGACIMLRAGRCRVYPARPRQCRTWPFWPENLTRRRWYGEVRKRCPGVGRGRRYTEEEIERIIATGGHVS